MKDRGFTLLEMLVATLIMGVAVVSLLGDISTSLRNAARLTDYDRGALLARRKMDELLADRRLPKSVPLEGQFDPALTGGVEGGWRAQLTTFDKPPNTGPGQMCLERVELEVWWMSAGKKHTFALDGYRRGIIRPEEAPPGGPIP
jgi:general secretion pathway protein I